MSIDSLIRQLIVDVKKDHKIFPYLYNAGREYFNVEKDWVFYSGPNWDQDEVVGAIKSLLTAKWLVSGENVRRFEVSFSKKFKLESSVMVNSGSSANLVLVSSLKKYFNWKDGDEVIVSTVGFPTTVAPLIQNQLTPVFVDIDMSDLNFNLDQVEQKIGSKTKAIFLSPVLANAPDMDRLVDMAKSRDILLVLDNCDSLGSKWKEQFLNEYSIASSCSFYPAHHISTGEGGMVSSNDEDFIKLARSFVSWGRDCYCIGAANLQRDGSCGKRFDKWLDDYDGVIDHKYLFTQVGYNLKPLDLQGAMGLAQLEKFDDAHQKRNTLKKKIGAMFEARIEGVRICVELPEAETGWFGVPIVCDNRGLKTELVAHLEANRIQTRNYFAGNILLHPAYKEFDDFRKYPEANKVLDQVFFVGCHPSYGEDVLSYIDHVLSEFSRNA